VKFFLAIALRSLLALALVGGGLSGWAMSETAMSMNVATQAHDGEVGPCHHTPSQDVANALTLAAGSDHCADSDDCDNASCNHLCLAAGLAVPVRAHSSVWPSATCPPVAFTTPSPHNLSSPPKRPPRA